MGSSNELAHEAADIFWTAVREGMEPPDAMRMIVDRYTLDTACTLTRLGLVLYCPQFGPQQHAYVRALRIAWRAVIKPTHQANPKTGRYETSSA